MSGRCDLCGCEAGMLYHIEPDELWQVPKPVDICRECELDLEVEARARAMQQLIDEVNS